MSGVIFRLGRYGGTGLRVGSISDGIVLDAEGLTIGNLLKSVYSSFSVNSDTEVAVISGSTC